MDVVSYASSNSDLSQLLPPALYLPFNRSICTRHFLLVRLELVSCSSLIDPGPIRMVARVRSWDGAGVTDRGTARGRSCPTGFGKGLVGTCLPPSSIDPAVYSFLSSNRPRLA